MGLEKIFPNSQAIAGKKSDKALEHIGIIKHFRVATAWSWEPFMGGGNSRAISMVRHYQCAFYLLKTMIMTYAST